MDRRVKLQLTSASHVMSRREPAQSVRLRVRHEPWLRRWLWPGSLRPIPSDLTRPGQARPGGSQHGSSSAPLQWHFLFLQAKHEPRRRGETQTPPHQWTLPFLLSSQRLPRARRLARPPRRHLAVAGSEDERSVLASVVPPARLLLLLPFCLFAPPRRFLFGK
jgi:hypothetical protein